MSAHPLSLVLGLALAALATLPALHASPGRLDTSKRTSRFSTDQKSALPELQPLERNEVLLDKRFDAGAPFERKEALVGERRSDIAVEETREKTTFATPEQKKYEVIERKESPWAGKKSRFSTSEDAYRSKVATRFQDKIGEATPFNKNQQTVVSRETTFDKINRFSFRKNGDQRVTVTTAGSETAPTDVSDRTSLSGARAK